MRERERREREWTSVSKKRREWGWDTSRRSERGPSGCGNSFRYSETHQNRSNRSSKNPKETTFLFYNFPETWEVPHLWRLFKRYGGISDVYLARKRLRNGRRFGFARFKLVRNAEAMEKVLRGIWIGMYRLRVHVANHNGMNQKNGGKGGQGSGPIKVGKSTKAPKSYGEILNQRETKSNNEDRKHQSYADAVRRGSESEQKDTKSQPVIGEWDADQSRLEYLQLCAVGNVEKLDHIVRVNDILNASGSMNNSIKLLGGREVLIKFGSQEELDKLVADKSNGIHYWVKDLSKWTPGFRTSERLAWLKVEGLPLQIWKQETFKDIASRWGRVLEVHNCDLEESDIVMWGKILIGTCLRERISVITSVKVGHLYYVIRVEEDDGALQDNHNTEEENFWPNKEEDDASDDAADDGLNSSSDWSAEESGSEEDWLVEESIFEDNNEKPSMKGNSKERNCMDSEAMMDDTAVVDSGVKSAAATGDQTIPINDRKEDEETNTGEDIGNGDQTTPIDDRKEDEATNSGEDAGNGAFSGGGFHNEASDHFGKSVKSTDIQIKEDGVGPVKQLNKPSTNIGPLDNSENGPIGSTMIELLAGNKDGPNLKKVIQSNSQVEDPSNQLQDIQPPNTTLPEKERSRQYTTNARRGFAGEKIENQDISGPRLRSCRNEFKVFGRGRMSFHLLKQKARNAQKKGKKPGSSMMRSNSNSSGNKSSADSINHPQGNEAEVENRVPNEELERFGEAIGVIWNKESTGDAQIGASS
ncbi:hypothetical protein OSB04_005026 [Centaurea solstitialis]|uniref:RRM domain-containing protein n=1 Tax=Centaurea solstitialis TaxID=347529 RepID=A0AA38WRV2_9ASTR|nr:hypothetical protein OSB04_005026 [Centaurea solstitialis]